MKKVYLKPLMTEAESDKWEGKLLKEEDCEILITEDADVYDKETGRCIAKFRKGLIPPKVQIAAYEALKGAAIQTDARGTATGLVKEGKFMGQKTLKNGKLAKKIWAHGKTVNSGIIGFYERTVRFPSCRLTSFNKHQFEKFVEAYPIIKLVDNIYSKLMPKEYKIQRGLADKSSKDYVITGTSFSTVTVNKNWQTAVHKDKGDLREGFGNLVALRKGKYTGGHFVAVRWGVGFDLQNGDVLLVDVHQWHGNTPIVADKNAVRLSLVMYFREKIKLCGTAAQELKRVQNRKKGEKLYDEEI